MAAISRPMAADGALGGLVEPRVVRDFLAGLTELTGIPAVIRDSDGHFVGSPTALPAWCGLLRRSAFGFDGCRAAALAGCPSDAGRVSEFACHGGLRHLSATVVVEGRVLAQIVLGPYKSHPVSDHATTAEADRQGISADALIASGRDVKWLPEARVRAVSRVLGAGAAAFSRAAAETQERLRLALAANPPPKTPPRARELLGDYSILVVEPDASARVMLQALLEDNGFAVCAVGTGSEASDFLDCGVPDIVLLNPQLRDRPGFELCERAHEHNDVPVVILSAVGDENSVVEALARYAEDYIVRPVGDRELVARLRRVVRRSARNRREANGCIPFVDQHLTISPGRREATLDGRVARLTPTECRILSYLAQRPNQTVPSETLLHECWAEGDGDPSQLWVHIRALRRKIEPDPDHPSYLLTRRGEGYSFARRPTAQAQHAQRGEGPGS